MRWGFHFPPYVPVHVRQAKAEREAAKQAKKGVRLSPVKIEGNTIARTFWGKAWCVHLESFSDYSNRLPRGRTYVRNGSVIDLQIKRGSIEAQVMGSSLYRITIEIDALPNPRWKSIKGESAGKIDSLVELLQGRLSDAVMRLITDRDRGIFPGPREIRMRCSCPDSAGLCKHLAAVLYGVGARFDTEPSLLFLLRGADHLELITSAASAAAPAGPSAAALDDDALADVFGIDISAGADVSALVAERPAEYVAAKPGASARKRGGKSASDKAKAPPKGKTTEPPQRRPKAPTKAKAKVKTKVKLPKRPTK